VKSVAKKLEGIPGIRGINFICILLKFVTISLTKLNSKLITFVKIDFFYAN